MSDIPDWVHPEQADDYRKAIMAATERERARCAQVADHYTTARNVRRARELTTHEVYEVKIFARLIGAAIRNPSFPKPANTNFATLELRGTIS